jgi:hypothetical protein
MHTCPAQKELQRLGRPAAGKQLGGLQTLAGVSSTPPVLPVVSLGSAGPKAPLRFIGVGFVIATNALSVVAMRVRAFQFLSPLCSKVRCISNYSIVR